MCIGGRDTPLCSRRKQAALLAKKAERERAKMHMKKVTLVARQRHDVALWWPSLTSVSLRWTV